MLLTTSDRQKSQVMSLVNLACMKCTSKFCEAIDFNTIILQTTELRIIDQSANLYLLEEPAVTAADGNIVDETVAEYQLHMFMDMEALNASPDDRGINIPALSADCQQDVHDLKDDLSDLFDRIGRAFDCENWLKAQALVELAATEDESDVLTTHPLYILDTTGTTGQPKGITRETRATCVGLNY